MSDHEHDDNLIHLDGLQQLAARAALMQGEGGLSGEELNYERLGVCSPDLVFSADGYAATVVASLQRGEVGFAQALRLLFLAGFDIGYQARLEIETRAFAAATPEGDPEPDVQ